MIEDFFSFYTVVILYQELTHFCTVEFLLYGESNRLGALITTGNLFFSSELFGRFILASSSLVYSYGSLKRGSVKSKH